MSDYYIISLLTTSFIVSHFLPPSFVYIQSIAELSSLFPCSLPSLSIYVRSSVILTKPNSKVCLLLPLTAMRCNLLVHDLRTYRKLRQALSARLKLEESHKFWPVIQIIQIPASMT